MKWLRKMMQIIKGIKSILKCLKGVIWMTFTKNSALVRSYVLLIVAGYMTYEEVPALFNMREAVAEALMAE